MNNSDDGNRFNKIKAVEFKHMINTVACKQSISITGVVLAGGLARRMGGKDKALLPLMGKHLIQHIVDMLEYQVDGIIVNANRNHKLYEKLGYDIISDQIDGFAGPLAGIAAALQTISTTHLLVVPCDSPFLPADLVLRFRKSLTENKADICVAHDGNRLQPVFALISKTVLPSLIDYLNAGQHKIDTWYQQQNMTTVDFSDIPQTFININTPDDLRMAEMNIVQHNMAIPIIGFAAHSGTGKTTLLKKLIPLLKQKGLRIGLVKHAHHGFEIDVPGKDSYELRKAGATQVIVGSKLRWALMVETPDQQEKPTLANLINKLDHSALDLILVEGFKLENIPKIEVYRSALGKQRLSADQKGFLAIASDYDLSDEAHFKRLNLNDTEAIAQYILEYLQQWKTQRNQT